ncbi:MAG TPA: teichoic acid transporter [Aquabacterium sp.]|uniref:lipopolysaccharide biosynthesis protein n=1 Tax=Aquabacterium sp. TaxID=1872578 RepID=UPI002E355F93|nr:teichoic acid transporter [Aquabacterium sp.]HEX5356961.1 teichoic acid transporter [Aquabacterium sp.]
MSVQDSRPPAVQGGSTGAEVPRGRLAALRQALSALPRAALGNLIAKLMMVGLGLAITVTVARHGPQVQGAFALFVAVESALLTLFTGLGLWLARQMSQQADGQHGRALPMLQGVLRAAVAFGLLASLVLLGVSWWARAMPYTYLWLLALAAPFLLLVPTATGLWLGEGRMWPINVAQVSAPASVLVGLGGAWWITQGGQGSRSTVLLVLTAWVTGKSIVAVVTAFYALRHARQRDERLEDGFAGSRLTAFLQKPPSWVAQWPFVATIGVTNVIGLLNYRVSLFLVERFDGLSTTGVYSVAVTAAELLWLLSSSVTVSVYSRIGHPDVKIAAAMTVQAVRINVLSTLLAAPVLLGLAWWGLPWVMGPAYEASLLPLAALLPGVAAYAAASSLSAFYTNHLGRPQLSGAIAGMSLTISFCVGWFLVPLWGPLGAGVASSTGYIVAIVAAYGVFLKHARLPVKALWQPALTRVDGSASA